MSQKLKISDLISHKDNDFFFDDISGDAWQEFIDSVKTSGVIEPIVVTQDKVIVSGHQRVRACKSLNIEEIEAEVRIFDSDDEILKCLIETNIRQRGIGNTNPVKFGRCLDELKRIYGIQHGNNQHSIPNNSESSMSEEQLASSIGISVDTMENYIKLSKMIPEIQTLVETGIVTPTTARAIVKKLPGFQQKELAKQFYENGEKVTQKEAQAEIDRLKARVDDLVNTRSQRETFEKNRADRLQSEKESLKARIKELEDADPETVEKEVYPEDYESNKEDLAVLKQQMTVNAKIELADFVKKYSDYVDIRSLIENLMATL